MVKKILLVFLVLLSFTNLDVVAKSQHQYFVVRGDKECPQEAYQIKNELIQSFQNLVIGLDESQYASAIENNLIESENVSYHNNTIMIILGEGDGVQLEGELKTNYCKAQNESIETHFFFWEWLNSSAS